MIAETNLHTPGDRVETREAHSLIASDRVEGIPVYRSNGDKIGRIERVMIDKVSEKIRYAVIGGFMGVDKDYYPVPWNLLTYNPRFDGYEINIGDEQLKGGPKYSPRETWDWSSGERDRTIDDYYKAPSFRSV